MYEAREKAKANDDSRNAIKVNTENCSSFFLLFVLRV